MLFVADWASGAEYLVGKIQFPLCNKEAKKRRLVRHALRVSKARWGRKDEMFQAKKGGTIPLALAWAAK
jgi:hypothetical protein